MSLYIPPNKEITIPSGIEDITLPNEFNVKKRVVSEEQHDSIVDPILAKEGKATNAQVDTLMELTGHDEDVVRKLIYMEHLNKDVNQNEAADNLIDKYSKQQFKEGEQGPGPTW